MTSIGNRIIRNCRLAHDYYTYGGLSLVINAVVVRGRTLLPIDRSDPDKETITVTLLDRDYEVLTEFPSATEWRQYEAGVVEPEVKRPFRDILDSGDVVVDIGGFCGDTTLYAHSLVGDSGRVFSFEPDPYLADIIRRNVNLNQLGNVEVLNAALGSQSGELPARAVLGDVREAYRSEIDGDSTINVRTLSEVTADIGSIPDLVKVDVDGAEYDVLKGGTDLFGQCPILLELHHDGMLQQWEKTVDLIFSQSSNVQYMGSQGLSPNRHPYGTQLIEPDELDRTTVTNLLLK